MANHNTRSDRDATGGIIPYRNPAALTAYYIAIASLIGLFLPPLGLIAGIVAVVLGVKGWKAYRANPPIGGNIHCWIGIILGGIVALICLVVTGFIVLAILGP